MQIFLGFFRIFYHIFPYSATVYKILPHHPLKFPVFSFISTNRADYKLPDGVLNTSLFSTSRVYFSPLVFPQQSFILLYFIYVNRY